MNGPLCGAASLILAGSFFLMKAQSGFPVLLPVPMLEADGSIPKGASQTGVFLSADLNNAVLVYAGAAGVVRRSVVPLRRKIRPVVTTRVENAPGGYYKYTYAIASGSEDALPIGVFTISDPELRSPVLSTLPSGWIGEAVSGRLQLKSATSASAVRRAGSPVIFVVTSRHRPGLVPAFIQAVDADKSVPPADLPEELLPAFKEVLAPSFNGQAVMVFAPKYDTSVSSAQICHDVLAYTQLAQRLSQLDRNSAFAKEAEAILRQASASADPAQVLAGFQARNRPATPKEQEIHDLIRTAVTR